ncbi:ATP-binding cassette domain-containing protein [Lachnospiraceae bacterium YH-ros2228]
MEKIIVSHVDLVLGKKKILDDICLKMEKGKTYGLVGRNGSGKTMLMKCILGFVKVTSGEITVDGKRIRRDIDFPDDTGMIIETPGFIPYYSGYKNLKLLADLRHKIGDKEVREAMGRVGLDPTDKKHVKKYSLGMRQRLGIAQAVMEDPDLLVLDEPFNGLDNEGVEEMHDYFLELKKRGKTMILVSHSSEDIDVLCDEAVYIEHGKIVARV